MQYQPNNAWLFIHPDFDTPGLARGIQSGPNGKIAMVNNRDSIRQSILLLISTMPGERVMRPKYGCDLQQLAFMPNDATTHGLAMHYVRTAIEQWESRIDIIHLDAEAKSDSPHVINIQLQYRVRHSQQNEQLIIAYHLIGAEINAHAIA